MEKHIFKFGDSSLAMIIPKKWCEKHSISANTTVHVSEDENGGLVLSVGSLLPKEAEKSITGSTDPFTLSRWLGLHYMYGTAKLHLYSKDGFSTRQLELIENKVADECPGFEITSQSTTDIMIEDFTNIKDIDINRIVSRLRSLVEEEFRELREGNPKTIRKIEKLINRFYMLGIRYINTMQPKDSLKQFSIFEALESIADGLNAVSSLAQLPKPLIEDLGKQFRLCFDALSGDSKSIENVASMRDSITRRLKSGRADRLQAYIVMGISDNISKISEFGLKEEKSSNEYIDLVQ
ncbi:MAG: AbrB/MazE/SpoVT family DNA-binding domain-containing protein [Candidatus Marsarchaeota archaeon]|nr:AbrB/MazE/SpoVT family DNA-binding domain-containing protein [Candidatus Marsarchaeota archaeon]